MRIICIMMNTEIYLGFTHSRFQGLLLTYRGSWDHFENCCSSTQQSNRLTLGVDSISITTAILFIFVFPESAQCQAHESQSENEVTQSCLTLCDPMDYTVRGILQARILVWVAFPFRGSSQPRDQTQVSCIAGGFFISWAARGAPST